MKKFIILLLVFGLGSQLMAQEIKKTKAEVLKEQENLSRKDIMTIEQKMNEQADKKAEKEKIKSDILQAKEDIKNGTQGSKEEILKEKEKLKNASSAEEMRGKSKEVKDHLVKTGKEKFQTNAISTSDIRQAVNINNVANRYGKSSNELKQLMRLKKEDVDKMNIQEKAEYKEVKTVVLCNQTDAKIIKAEKRLGYVKKKLMENEMAGKYTEEELKEKKALIDQCEERLNKLKEEVDRGKQMIERPIEK